MTDVIGYLTDNLDFIPITEITTNRSITIDEALDICGIDMDEWASSQGWDGYDPNRIITKATYDYSYQGRVRMTEDLSPVDVNFEVARINKIYPEEVLGRRPDLKSIIRRSDTMMVHSLHEDISFDLETLSIANVREILPKYLPCGVSFWRGETKVWEGNAKRLLQ